MDEYSLLVRFLTAIGLEDHLHRFEKEGITFSDLRLLTLDELEEVGFHVMRDRLASAASQKAQVLV